MLRRKVTSCSRANERHGEAFPRQGVEPVRGNSFCAELNHLRDKAAERYSATSSPRDTMVRSRLKLHFSSTRQDASFPTTTRPTSDGNSSCERASEVSAAAISLARPLPQRSRFNV